VEILENVKSTNITNPGNTWKGVNTMEEQAKIDEFTTDILPLIEEYENGGERPELDDILLRRESGYLLDRILKEDSKRRKQKI
jgi:hypothetical protein